jgi:hypothetical protein
MNQFSDSESYEPPQVRDLGRLEDLTRGAKPGPAEKNSNMS